jgi:hypothetical protein
MLTYVIFKFQESGDWQRTLILKTNVVDLDPFGAGPFGPGQKLYFLRKSLQML